MLFDHLEKLTHFLGVARYGSIRKYAIKENISQSAVSKSMQILENVLDCDLFVRKRTGVELTQAGSELLVFSEKLSVMSTETEQKLKKHNTLVLSGSLKIGSYQSISVYFMPKLFKFIKENQSNLKIDLTSESSSNLIAKVKSGNLDLCVSVNPKPHKNLTHIHLYEDYYSIFKPVNLKAPLDIYTYLEAQDAKGNTVLKHLAPLANIFNFVSCGDFETAKAMVVQKLGFGLLPNWVAKPYVEDGTLQKVKLDELPLNFGEHCVGLTYKNSKIKNDAVMWVAEQTKIMMGV